MRALFNDDQLTRGKPGNYLRRSAGVLCAAARGDESLEQDMGHHHVGGFFKVLTATGITFQHKKLIDSSHMRRVGHVYITKDAVGAIVKELILHSGQVLPTRRRLLFSLRAAGNRLCGLLPGNCMWWACLLEDILTSPWWMGVRTKLLKECTEHGEFLHLSMDATIRVLRRVVGQVDYRASKLEKANQMKVKMEADLASAVNVMQNLNLDAE